MHLVCHSVLRTRTTNRAYTTSASHTFYFLLSQVQRPHKQHSGLEYKHQHVPLKPIEDNILQLVCHRAIWERILHRNNARWNIEWYYSAIHLYVCCFPGSFREAEAETGQYVRWLRDYCQAFYYWLVVKLLPPVTVAATGCAFRVNSSSHNLQIHAGERNQLTTPGHGPGFRFVGGFSGVMRPSTGRCGYKNNK